MAPTTNATAAATAQDYSEETRKEKDAGIADASGASVHSESDSDLSGSYKSSRMSGSAKLMWALAVISLIIALFLDSALLYGYYRVKSVSEEYRTFLPEVPPVASDVSLADGGASSAAAASSSVTKSISKSEEELPKVSLTFFEKIGLWILDSGIPKQEAPSEEHTVATEVGTTSYTTNLEISETVN